MESIFSSDECADVIKLMAISYGCNCDYEVEYKHISYLIMKNEEMPGSGVAVTLSCDLSGFSWKRLIEKNALDYDTMQIIISQGGSLSLQDVQGIIELSIHESAAVLLLALNSCMPKYNEIITLFELALRFERFVFAGKLAEYSPVLSNIKDLNTMIAKIIEDYQTEKMELLTLLVQHSAHIEGFTCQENTQTTLIHLMTRFAINSGK